MKQIAYLDRLPWIVSGFGIGASVSLLVCLGVNFILSVIRNLKLPEHEILLFTVLFYGSIFFIAHSGVRANMRRNKALTSAYSTKDFDIDQKETKSPTARVRTVLWNVMAAVSLVWLTPALIIYWIAPRHPGTAYAACCFIFSMAGASAFLLKTGKKDQTVYNSIMFLAGTCTGAFAVASFFPFF